MAAASRSLATALWRARFASGLLHPSYTINRDTTWFAARRNHLSFLKKLFDDVAPADNKHQLSQAPPALHCLL